MHRYLHPHMLDCLASTMDRCPSAVSALARMAGDRFLQRVYLAAIVPRPLRMAALEIHHDVLDARVCTWQLLPLGASELSCRSSPH